MAKRSQLDWVGAVSAERLSEIGIDTFEDLLREADTAYKRKQLAQRTGISSRRILLWTNRVDMARIKGVGLEYADLLEAAGVCSVPCLGETAASELHTRLVKTNHIKKLVRRVPAVSRVSSWVDQAKVLSTSIEQRDPCEHRSTVASVR